MTVFECIFSTCTWYPAELSWWVGRLEHSKFGANFLMYVSGVSRFFLSREDLHVKYIHVCCVHISLQLRRRTFLPSEINGKKTARPASDTNLLVEG